MQTATRTAITANPHDDGWDILAGTDVTNAAVGVVYLSDDGSGNLGLVLGIFDDYDRDATTTFPDDVAEVVAILRDAGYELTAESVADVEALAARTGTVPRPETVSALAELARITAERHDLVNRARALVAQARAGGASWAQIGAALGMSKQAAHERYGP